MNEFQHLSPSAQVMARFLLKEAGVPAHEIEPEAELLRTLRKSSAFVAASAGLVEQLYTAAGRDLARNRMVYSMLQKEASSGRSAGAATLYDMFIDPFIACLGRISSGDMEKTAAALSGALMGGMRALGSTPDLIKTLAAAAGLGGAAAGSLYWWLDRQAKGDDENLAAMEAKTDVYRKLTHDLDEELRQRNIATQQNQALASTEAA